MTLASKVKDELVRSAMNVFEMKHPVIWTFNDTSTSKSLMKSLLTNGHFCQFATEKHLQYLNSNSLQDIIIIANKVEKLEEIIEEASQYSKALVIFGFHKISFKIEVEIDKKVFLVKEADNGRLKLILSTITTLRGNWEDLKKRCSFGKKTLKETLFYGGQTFMA